MHNCNYNKLSLLVHLRSMIWRMEQYRKDAKEAGHPLCEAAYNDLEKDLQKHAGKLQKAIVGLAKEDKLTFCEKC